MPRNDPTIALMVRIRPKLITGSTEVAPNSDELSDIREHIQNVAERNLIRYKPYERKTKPLAKRHLGCISKDRIRSRQ